MNLVRQLLLICAEGISQAGMLAFQFGAAREREKLAKRVSHRLALHNGDKAEPDKLISKVTGYACGGMI